MDRTNNFFGIDDPDMPIYRIFQNRFFPDEIRDKESTLINPNLWADPYEKLPWRCKIIRRKPKYKEAMLHPFLPPVYAQCWSAAGESETLLRAYSRVDIDKHSRRNKVPNEEGVTVRSTPRKLLDSLQAWAPAGYENRCFIGRVKYFSEDDIKDRLGNILDWQIPHNPVSERQMAKFLLLKRTAFQHENEIRLIYVEKKEDSPEDIKSWKIEPNEIFDSIMFDPRLTADLKEREETVRNFGYQGEFLKSALYDEEFLSLIIN